MTNERACQRCGNPMKHINAEPGPIVGVVGAWICDLCEIGVSDNDDYTDETRYWWL